MNDLRMNFLEEMLSHIHSPKYSEQKLMELLDLAHNRPWELNPNTEIGSVPVWLYRAWAALMYRALELVHEFSAKGEPIPMSIEQVLETQLDLVPPNLKNIPGLDAMHRYANTFAAYSYSWESAGKHIYDITPELSWIFANTIIEDIPTEYIALPYNCIVINLRGLKTFMDQQGSLIELTHAILARDLDDEKLIRVTYAGKTATETQVVKLTTYSFKINLGKETVKDAIETEGKEHFIPYIYYCVNALMYITSKESDDILKASSLEYIKLAERAKKAKGPAKKRFKEQLSKVPPRYVHRLGTKTVIDRKKTDASVSSNKTAAAPRVGHFVRGHWHHYWVGEGRKELVRKLLHPFWRGAPPTEEQLRETHVCLLK
jgi:hypothetical protein